MTDAPVEPDDVGDDDAWPEADLLEVHELNELGADITVHGSKPLDKMTKAELFVEAEVRGVELPAKATKADIIAALEDS